MNPFRIFLPFVGLVATLGLASSAAAQTVGVTLTTPTTNYVAGGGTVTLTATITYSAQPTALGGSIFLPPGWSFASVGGSNVPNLVPGPGATVQLDFAYFTIPAASAQFTVGLNYPAGLAGNQTISSSFEYRSPTQTITPAAIFLAPAGGTGNTAPVITAQPQNTSATIGGSAVLSVAATGTPAPTYQWLKNGGSIAGATGTSLILANFQVSDAGSYAVDVTNAVGTVRSQSAAVSVLSTALAITTQPQNTSATIGSSAVLTVAATGTPAPTYQWRKNGAVITGATGTTLMLANFQVSDAGAYAVDVTNTVGTVRSQSAAVGVLSTAKVAGAATEFGADITHPNGNVYDQVLLTGASATITADATQITRTSFIDLNDDIVQVEFGGAGTLTLVLENATGPAAPLKYNQPGVSYMKGHASLTITGANETTNVTVFSVGTATAVNQALFPAGVIYDNIADIGLISIATTNGKFGGIRTSNAGFFRAAGLTGIYAPGVAVQGPTFVGDITADAEATGVMVFGATTDVRITGGDLLQLNNRAIAVDGINLISFTAGTKSGGQTQAVQTNRGRLERNGVDVTSQLVH